MVHVISVTPEHKACQLIEEALAARQQHRTVKICIPGIDGQQHQFEIRRKSQTIKETGTEFDKWWDQNCLFFLPEAVRGLWLERINEAVGLAIEVDRPSGCLQLPGQCRGLELRTDRTSSELFEYVADVIHELQRRGATEQGAQAAS